MLLGTLGATLLGYLLTGKRIIRAGPGRPLSSASQNKKGKGIVRAGPDHSSNENKKQKGFVRAGTGRPSFSASQNKKQWDF